MIDHLTANEALHVIQSFKRVEMKIQMQCYGVARCQFLDQDYLKLLEISLLTLNVKVFIKTALEMRIQSTLLPSSPKAPVTLGLSND